jgi:hypothetical protein
MRARKAGRLRRPFAVAVATALAVAAFHTELSAQSSLARPWSVGVVSMNPRVGDQVSALAGVEASRRLLTRESFALDLGLAAFTNVGTYHEVAVAMCLGCGGGKIDARWLGQMTMIDLRASVGAAVHGASGPYAFVTAGAYASRWGGGLYGPDANGLTMDRTGQGPSHGMGGVGAGWQLPFTDVALRFELGAWQFVALGDATRPGISASLQVAW